MATNTSFGLGGYNASAPAQNKSEQWTNATQPSDPTPVGYTAWNADGTVQTQRALTGAESAQLAAQDSTATGTANQSSFQSKALAALTANPNDVAQDTTIVSGATTINGTANATINANPAAAIKQLAQAVAILAGNDVNTKKELQALIYLALGKFDVTTGT